MRLMRIVVEARALFVFSLLTLLTACGGDTGKLELADEQFAAALEPPPMLFAVRAVDPDKLQLEVTVNGSPVSMSAGGDGVWRGTLRVSPGAEYRVLVRWYELYQDQALLLAEAIETLPVTSSQAVTVSLSDAQFDSSFDNDRDLWSNLHERRTDTDPFSNGSPGTNAPRVSLQLNLSLPSALQNTALDQGSLSPQAFVNGLGVPLSQSGDIRSGNVLVSDGDRASVIVRWNSQLSNGSVITLARSVNAVQIAGNQLYSPPDSSFRFAHDNDLDGKTNLDELLQGTDPQDANH